MNRLNLVLDHVGVAVPDLEWGRAAYARLGFQLTPRSLHSGSLTPGGPVQPWGSGNHCAMFESGYLEVIGLTDPSLPSSVKDLVKRHVGLHILAIGCTEAERTREALVAAGSPIESVRALERDAAFGVAGDETRRAKFRNLYVDRSAFPEARMLLIEHETPEVLWQPHLLKHPNGVVGLQSLIFAADDPQPLASRLASLLQASVLPTAVDCEIPLARGALRVSSRAHWEAFTGEPTSPAGAGQAPTQGQTQGQTQSQAIPLPAPVGIYLRVSRLAQTRAWLEAAGVAVRAATGPDGEAALLVPAREACGATLIFVQNPESLA